MAAFLLRRLIQTAAFVAVLLGMSSDLAAQADARGAVPLTSSLGEVPYEHGYTDTFLGFLRLERNSVEIRQHIQRVERRTAEMRQLIQMTAEPGEVVTTARKELPALHAQLERYEEKGDLSQQAEVLLQLATTFLTLNEPDSSIAYAERSRSAQHHIQQYRSNVNRGIGYTREDRLADAIGEFRHALKLARDPGSAAKEERALSWMANAFRRGGERDSAYVYSAKAFRLREQHNIPADTLNFDHALHLPRAERLQWFHRYLGMARNHNYGRAKNIDIEMLYNIGVVHLEVARIDSAFIYFRGALAHPNAKSNPWTWAYANGGLGLVHAHLGRADSARHYFNEMEQAASVDPYVRRTALINLGSVHASLGEHEAAVYAYAEARRLAREQSDHQAEMRAANNIGAVHQSRREWHRARQHFVEALRIVRDQGYGDSESAILYNLGATYDRQYDLTTALRWYGEALEAARRQQQPHRESAALSAIGSVQRRLGAFNDAEQSYRSAVVALASVEAHVTGDQDRISAAEQNVRLFEAWALTWLALASEVGEEGAQRAALAVSERGRAQALLDMMSFYGGDGLTHAAATPPPDPLAEGIDLAAIGAETGAATVTFMMAGDTLLTWLALPTGELAFRTRELPQDSLADLVSSFRETLGVDDALTRGRLVRGVDAGAARPARRPSFADQMGEELAQLLLPDLDEAVARGTELVLIPHGVLAMVPFSALRVGGEHLGLRNPIRYAPSIETLRQVERRPTGWDGQIASLGQSVVVGDPAMPEAALLDSGYRQALSPLPGAREEARAVGARIGVGALTGSAATESAVREALPTAPIVHLATHGLAYSSTARALDSFVALAADSRHDGIFTVHEVIEELPALSAELVVLSACQTGLGSLRKAEGTVGLQRAFLGKGARSVLVSLWSVSDDATRLLMDRFYGHWLGGEPAITKAEALRLAQDDVRSTDEFHDPVFWAGFQLVGAN